MRGLFPVAAFTTVLAACVLAGLSVAYTWSGQATGTFQAQVGVWGPIPATVDIDPDTLNPASQGNFVTAYIELPEGHEVAEIDVSTVLLEVEDVDGSSVPAEPAPTEVGDHDADGIADRMVKFNRQALVALLDGRTGDITFRVRGEVSGSPFEGTDTIQVLGSQGDAEDAPTAAVTSTPSPTLIPTASPTPSATPVPAPGGIYVSVTCQGQPVAGAQVRVSHQSPGEPVVWSGGTGDDGELSTGLVLKAGSYLVDIVKQGASYDSVIAAVPAGGYAPVYAQCTALWGTGYPDW